MDSSTDTDVHLAAHAPVEVVPLLGTFPPCRKSFRGRVVAVGDLRRALQDARRVRRHVRTRVHELVPPRELVLDSHVGGVVDRGDTTTVFHVVLYRLALRVVLPDHPGGLEHDDDVVGGEVVVVEDAGVLGVVEREVVLGGQVLEHLDPGRDRIVPVSFGLGEQQCVELGFLCLRDRRNRSGGE